jgi:serine/threonine-protein kinase
MISYGKDDINKIRKFASTYDIKLNEIREFSKDVEAGKIISVSKKAGEGVQTGESIDVVISSGSKIIIPDFTNMDLNAAKDLCNKNKLDCSISYANSTKNKNKIIGQNKRSGSEVIEGTNVVLTVSNGIKPSSKSTTSTSTRTSSKITTTNKNTSNTSTKPTSSCNKTKNLTLYLGAGSSSSETKNMTISQSPGVRFNWVLVDHCPNGSTDSGTVCSSSVPDGSNVSACDVVTVTIIK